MHKRCTRARRKKVLFQRERRRESGWEYNSRNTSRRASSKR